MSRKSSFCIFGIAAGVAIVCALLLGAHVSWAQVTLNATITGTVADSTGAVVPGATVTATNQDTGFHVSIPSNGDGTFVLPALQLGTYSVTVTKQGFQTFTEKGIVLHAATVTTVNPILTVGQAVTRVTVQASVAQVQTSTGEVAGQVASEQVSNLPLNGRNFLVLEGTMPGTSNNFPDTALSPIGQVQLAPISANGLGVSGSYFYLDGILNENTGDAFNITITPSPDSIQEVRVLQNNYSAQYSMLGGTVVTVQTKSGTDTFHGTLFEYLRNNNLNARNFFSPTVPALKQNIFGGTIGGPLFLPGHRPKNPKTFFFYSNQTTIISSGSTVTGITATAAQRQGTFTTAITDPTTGLPFGQNSDGTYQIPSNRLNTSSLLLINATANLPNYAVGSQNFLNLNPGYTRARDDQIKLDHNFSEKLRLTGQFFDESAIEHSPNDSYTPEIWTTVKSSYAIPDKLAQIQVTDVISPSMVNTASYGWNYINEPIQPSGTWNLSQVPGFSETLPYTGGPYSNRLPQITFSQGYSTFGGTPSLPEPHSTHMENSVTDDWSWLRGKHYLQGGLNMMFGMASQAGRTLDFGQYAFTGNFTGNAMADYMLGLPSTFSQVSGSPWIHAYYEVISPYFQDAWKVTRRLTLTFGLREEYAPTPHNKKGLLSNFDPALYNSAQAPIVNTNGTITTTASYNPLNGLAVNGVNGVPLSFSPSPNWYTAPTFGFAWDMFGDGKTALRGGYGVTYDHLDGNECDLLGCASNPPFIQSITLVNPQFPNPVGAAQAPPSAPSLTAQSTSLKYLQVQQYSLSLEHSFGGNWIASIAEAGDVARHAETRKNINQPLPDPPYDFNPIINSGTVSQYDFAPFLGYAGISYSASEKYGYWNALEISVRHPVGQNLFLTASYTYQHGLGTANGIMLYQCCGGYQDIYHPQRDYGNDGVTAPQVLGITYMWNLPYQNTHGFRGMALGGWKYSGIVSAQSGLALNPGLSASHSGLATRPNRVAGSSVAGPKTRAQWFNTNAFVQPAAGYFGTAAPGSIWGPGVVDFDMSLQKDFHVTERAFFSFRAELFNAFNHTNFSGVSTSFGSGTYGQVTSARDPRIAEIALRFQF